MLSSVWTSCASDFRRLSHLFPLRDGVVGVLAIIFATLLHRRRVLGSAVWAEGFVANGRMVLVPFQPRCLFSTGIALNNRLEKSGYWLYRRA